MPPVATDLEREKNQLVAGISALNRQINEAHYPLRKPWNELKREVADAVEPLVDDFYRRSQELIEGIERLYAESAALSRVAINAKIDKLRQFSGTMLASGREFRRSFDFEKEIPVEPTLVAFNELPAIKAMKYGIPQTIAPPSVLDMERDFSR